MKITQTWLKNHGACSDAVKWVFQQKMSEETQLVEMAMKKDRFDWVNWYLTHRFNKKQNVRYAIFAATKVLNLFEKKYPDNQAARKAIEAAEKYLKNPCKKTKNAAANAANAAYAAAHAAAHAAANAAYAAAHAAAHAAAYAAAYAAADAADAAANAAAYAADAADAAAYAAADAAADAAKKKLQKEIVKYGIGLLSL